MTKKLGERNIEELGQLFPIILSAPDPAWREIYSTEKTYLETAIGKDHIIRMAHIGSTAVPNLLSKPTIDILVEISEKTNHDKLISAIKKLGYHYIPRPENPPPHMMFAKGYSESGFEGQAFHAHIRYAGDWDEIVFRDYLIDHPGTAAEYAELKRQSAKQHKHNREAYTEAKTDFINQVMAIARNRQSSH